ncbi:hypothetical protein, variant [Microbotryum lychnidis-dioicae p1A1 Lamole]|uniref:REJ domain-containing protein n=1 Tax=Microbotryum lychnidis-dioicae (strain p1A1 Lamole / MvSl-1064) TaxID=683840 RepID=U5H0P5_USTV1|nr:hypothetical protein, variant [Microbotryum lychnidis-dioicae p1A1 Lamole]|eukprot:KDE08872.1 hypothetical protein, variant [Microbotryum lychnidis-dioicae p1A1 Lamole]
METTAPVGDTTTTTTGLAPQSPTSSTTSLAAMETTAPTTTADDNSSPSTAESGPAAGTATSSLATTTPATATTIPVDSATTTPSSPAAANTTSQFTPQASSSATTTPVQATTPVQSAASTAVSSSVLDTSNSAPSSSATRASSVAETTARTSRTKLNLTSSASATQAPTSADTLTSAAVAESTRSAVYETSLYTYTSSGGAVVYATTILTTYVFVPAATTTGARTLNSNGDASGGNGFFSKTGAVVGVFLAVGVIVAFIAVGVGFFYIRRKKRRRLDEDLRVAAGGAGDGGAGIARFNDDDSEDGHGNPYDPTSTSDGRMSSFGPRSTLSSYGAVGLTGAAAGYGLARTPYDRAHDDTPYRRPLSYGASVDSDHARQRRYSTEIGHYSPSPSDGSLHGMASAYGGFSSLGHSRAFSGEGAEEEPLPDWARGFFDQANGVSTERSSPEHSGGVERMEELEETRENPFVVSKPDDRIEPRTYKEDDNHSQESLADGQDYSRKRVLRVANPSDE